MYLNKKETRKRILAKMTRTRPECGFTRVSESVLRTLDIKIDKMLDRACHQHPSTGKTFREIL